MDFSKYVKEFIDNSKNIQFVNCLDYSKVIEYENKDEIDNNKEFYFTYNSDYKINDKINNEMEDEDVMDDMDDYNIYNSDTDTEVSDNEFEYFY